MTEQHISNRLPEADDVEWSADVMVNGEEEHLTLTLPEWFTPEEVQEAFVREARDVFWNDHEPLVLGMSSVKGTF
jgi:hypothetical protein